jgi:hypothetical protein
MPVFRRLTLAAVTSRKATGLAGAAPAATDPGPRRPDLDPDPAPAAGAAVSTSVFHSPQPGHLPVQAIATWPQVWQTWVERIFAIAS